MLSSRAFYSWASVACLPLTLTFAGGPVRAAEAVAKPAAAATVSPRSEMVMEPIYDGGLKTKWQDWGWARRDTELGKPARINFAGNAGWILVNRSLIGTFSAIGWQMAAPAKFGDFLEVRVASEADDSFPRVAITAKHRHTAEGGWTDVRVAMHDLNPSNLPFDRVIIRAIRLVDGNWVDIDRLSLLGDAAGAAEATAKNARYHRASLQIDCTKAAKPISPLIYGIAYNPHKNEPYQWRLGATERRWGGNPASRYNWKLGNAWNTASDWFFMNVNYTNQANYTWETFLDENRDHGVPAALTVPTLGWVAKDTTSYSYPVSVHGKQHASNPQQADVGDGLRPNNGRIAAGDPRRTSIPAGPEFVGEWVTAIQRYDEDEKTHSINMYILDNEPSLWNSTHRDVHPEPLTYDELLKRTIDYGTEIRKADPSAVIAGPAEWGWPGYFYSAKDAEAGFTSKPDRRAHGDEPLLAWYLRQLKAHEVRTGTRLINVLDVHYYPQADGIYGAGERNDVSAGERRVRSTRSLWDPTYKDESWIADRIRLIPRLRSLIAENYPGLEISIGEYNFGGERYMSGGIALAEALGRFGQEGVYSAFYWTYPPENSCAYHAFRAFRNYDGAGARFLDRSVTAIGDKTTSVFASTDDTGGKIVAVVLNLDPREGADATVDMLGCGEVLSRRTFQYTGTADGMHQLDDKTAADGKGVLKQKVPPYSITVFELNVDHAKHY